MLLDVFSGEFEMESMVEGWWLSRGGLGKRTCGRQTEVKKEEASGISP